MNDIAKRQETMPAAEVTPMQMLQKAVESGADLDKLEKLIDLERRWKADRAREAFVAAMVELKKEPLTVTKDRHVRFQTTKGVTEYNHATLAQVVDAVVSALSKHGLSHRWETTQDNGLITVSCVLTHALGHSERTTLTASPDDSGGKNSIQQIASTITYLERYTLMAATGLAARDMDNDAGAGNVEKINEDQIANLEALITEVGTDREKFLKVCKVEKLSDLPASKYEGAIKRLEQKRSQ